MNNTFSIGFYESPLDKNASQPSARGGGFNDDLLISGIKRTR